MLDACIEAIEPARVALTSTLRNHVVDDLMEGLKEQSWFTGFDISDESPVKYSLMEWIKHAKDGGASVFIAGSVILPPFLFFLLPLKCVSREYSLLLLSACLETVAKDSLCVD